VTTAGAGQAVGERGAPAGEHLEARLRIEVPAERELERERALVVAAPFVVDEQLREPRVAAFGEAVGLLGATGGLDRAPLPRGREVAVE